MKNETPDWLDAFLRREEITLEEYYMFFGITRSQFWECVFESGAETPEELESFILEAFTLASDGLT